MSKVTVVGAGAVGATCANVMACREVASEVVLIDIKEGLSEGKMLDMYQTSTLMDFDTKLVGTTNDYKKTANSDVVVITSGIPRKPGMTREELIGTNGNIMKGVIANVIKYSPRAIIIVVATVVAPSIPLAKIMETSRRETFETFVPVFPRYSISSTVMPTFMRPPKMAIVAGTAPCSRMICSTWSAVSTFCG